MAYALNVNDSEGSTVINSVDRALKLIKIISVPGNYTITDNLFTKGTPVYFMSRQLQEAVANDRLRITFSGNTCTVSTDLTHDGDGSYTEAYKIYIGVF